MHIAKKFWGARHRRRHRGSRGSRDPQSGARDREPVRQGQARGDADDRPRPRLLAGRAQPRAAAHDRRHPHGLDLLPGAPRRVPSRSGGRRAADGLRQAHARHHDRRLGRAEGRARRGVRGPYPQSAIFTDLDRIEGFGEAAPVDGGVTPEAALAHGMENFPIEELELGVRSYNCLKRVGIETI